MSTYSSREDVAVSILLKPESFPALAKRLEFERQLLLWRFPSFTPHSSWALYNVFGEKRYLVRRLEHDPGKGIPLNKEDPHIFGAEALISTASAEALLAELESLPAPMFRRSAIIGIDGTMFGLQAGNAWQGTKVNWWCHHSPEWQPLAAYYERVVAEFEALLPRSTLRTT
jgi:hypothetical protein